MLSLNFFADDLTLFFNSLHRPLGLKVLVSLSPRAFPGVLDLLALQQHQLDQLYPENVRKSITQAGKQRMNILSTIVVLQVSMSHLWPI